MAKPIKIDFEDVSGGSNTTEDMLKIRKNQVQDSLNAVLRRNGPQRRPGTLAGDVALANSGRGMHIYRELDGTEHRLLCSDQKIYSTPVNLSTKTELFDTGGDGKAYFANYLDKCWITNGSAMVKIEGTTGYQIGISPPSGVVATAKAGGTIPVGTYNVWVSYGRGNNLYSVGESIGSVVIDSTNKTVAITNFANSADGQVSNKVVWMQLTTQGLTYFWHETGDNTTTAFDITSNGNKNTARTYESNAQGNTIPTTFEYIYAHDARIFGAESNNLRYSIRSTTNVYDMERFVGTYVFPYQIKGIFHLRGNLYLNTTGGILVLPEADVDARFKELTDNYFFDINTVREYSGNIFGLTFDGMKIFDGEKFLDYDISADQRKEMEKIYNTTTSYSPCAAIRRTSIRTEYHLCYNDSSLSTKSNNARLVLNLNKLQLLPDKEVIAPWERHSNGANFMAVDLAQNMYMLQDHATVPKIYKYNTNNTYDNGIYKNDGEVGGATDKIYAFVTFRAILVDLAAYMKWSAVRVIIKQAATSTITGFIREISNKSNMVTVGVGSDSLWAEDEDDTLGFTWDVDNWAFNTFIHDKLKFATDLEGYILYLKWEQTANDPNLNLLNLQLEGDPYVTNFS